MYNKSLQWMGSTLWTRSRHIGSVIEVIQSSISNDTSIWFTWGQLSSIPASQEPGHKGTKVLTVKRWRRHHPSHFSLGEREIKAGNWHIKACKLAISSFNLRDREDPAANPGPTHQSLPTTQCCHGNKTQSDKHYSYWETAPRVYPLSLFKDLLLHVRVHTSLVPRPSSTCVSERVWRSERLFLSLLPDLRARIRLQTHNYMRGCRQLSTRFSTHGVHRNTMITFFIPFNPMWQEKSLRTPDPRPTFRGRGLGTRLGTHKEA